LKRTKREGKINIRTLAIIPQGAFDFKVPWLRNDRVRRLVGWEKKEKKEEKEAKEYCEEGQSFGVESRSSLPPLT